MFRISRSRRIHHARCAEPHSAEVIDGIGAAVRALVVCRGRCRGSARSPLSRWQQRDDNAGDAIWQRVETVAPPHVTSEIAIIAAGIWSFRVRCLFTDGTASNGNRSSISRCRGCRARRRRSAICATRSYRAATICPGIPGDVRIVPVEIARAQFRGGADRRRYRDRAVADRRRDCIRDRLRGVAVRRADLCDGRTSRSTSPDRLRPKHRGDA